MVVFSNVLFSSGVVANLELGERSAGFRGRGQGRSPEAESFFVFGYP